MIQNLRAESSVYTVVGDQCLFGLRGVDAKGEGFIKKPTMWITNSVEIAKVLDKRCDSKSDPAHRHCDFMSLGSRKGRIAERYPDKLVHAVLAAFRRQLQSSGEIGALECGPHVDEPDPWCADPSYYHSVFDSTSGKALDPDLVSEARKQEMTFLLKELGAYSYDTVENCVNASGKRPIPVVWVDVDKSSDPNVPAVRSRLCVAETKKQTAMDLTDPTLTFAATPPYECLRMLVSLTMTPRAGEEQDVLMFLDITRAHPHCPMRRKVWIALPAEDPRAQEPGVCGFLERSLYGLRDAGQSFELFVTETMTEKLDFEAGAWSPCLFTSKSRNLLAYVYGDNFVLKGVRANLYKFFEDLKTYMWAKNEGVLGPSPSQGDVQSVVCLNRTFRWIRQDGPEPESIEIEPDQRLVSILLEQFKLAAGGKSVVTPGVRATGSDLGKQLSAEEATAFRSACMRAAYLSEDRIDIRYAVKEASRTMSNPCEQGLVWLKRVVRYLVGARRLVQTFVRQKPVSGLRGYSDADFAGCLRTRASTSCAIVMHGLHMIKMISATQKAIALSSGESEYYALVRCAALTLGLTNMCRDLGRHLSSSLGCDSSAAIGVAGRRGAGKIRHIEVATLWLQKHVTSKALKLFKEKGTENVADLGTKHVDRLILERVLQQLGFKRVGVG